MANRKVPGKNAAYRSAGFMLELCSFLLSVNSCQIYYLKWHGERYLCREGAAKTRRGSEWNRPGVMPYSVPRRIASGGRKYIRPGGRHQLTISVPRNGITSARHRERPNEKGAKGLGINGEEDGGEKISIDGK